MTATASADTSGATINPHATNQDETCQVRLENGTMSQARAHKFHWVWHNGHMTNVVRCSTCGLEQENGV